MDDAQRKMRAGHLTASRFADLLTQPKSKADREAGEMSQTAGRYFREVLSELLTDAPLPEIHAAPLDWGTEQEPQARIEYSRVTGNVVTMPHPAFVQHTELSYVGCSPDGLIGDDGLLELKCPWTTQTHIDNLMAHAVPSDYVPQVQGQLWVTGRKWCDFVSYDPRIVYEGLDIMIVRVERDEEMIKRIEDACRSAWAWISKAVREIVGDKPLVRMSKLG